MLNSNSLHVTAFHLSIEIPKNIIEEKIKEMSVDEFKHYAEKFYHGDEYGYNPSWFKTHEEWEEVETKQYPIIRKEDGYKLCWCDNELVCLIRIIRF
jgi:hypothetical protein